MKLVILVAMLVNFPAFAKVVGIKTVKNQPYVDAIMRSTAGVSVSCENGNTVSIRGNTAYIGDLTFNWQAFATLDSDENGAILLNLYSRTPNNFTYDQLNSICTYAAYPAIIASHHTAEKPKIVGECNPWTNCR